MKLLELHILQTFPVSCLNRDDLNSPKTAIFGGVNRARVSSQSWKRAIRMKAKEILPDYYGGNRTKYVQGEIEKALKKKMDESGVQIEQPDKKIKEAMDAFIKESDEVLKTLMFLSNKEISALTDAILSSNGSEMKSKVKEIIKYGVSDFSDIALFGRMVAKNPDVNIEAAAMFSHAISTHKVDNDIDFFTAVDDKKPEDVDGAGHVASLEFNSATYYRYVAVNLDQLKSNFRGAVSDEEMKRIIEAFIKACLLAVPQARKNTMNADTLPSYVLGIVKDAGQPIQLVNAFETPVKRGEKGGISEESERKLKDEFEKLKRVWGIEDVCEASIPDKTFPEFMQEVLNHV